MNTKSRLSQEQLSGLKKEHGSLITIPMCSWVPGATQLATNTFGHCSVYSHRPPNANSSLAKTQLPIPLTTRPHTDPDSRPVRQHQPHCHKVTLLPLQRGRLCLWGWDEGTRPASHPTAPFHTLTVQDGGRRRHAGLGKGLQEETGHLSPPHRENGALHSLPSGVGVPSRRWRPRRWGWARRQAGVRTAGMRRQRAPRDALAAAVRRYLSEPGASPRCHCRAPAPAAAPFPRSRQPAPSPPGGLPERRPPVPSFFRSALLHPPRGRRFPGAAA